MISKSKVNRIFWMKLETLRNVFLDYPSLEEVIKSDILTHLDCVTINESYAIYKFKKIRIQYMRSDVQIYAKSYASLVKIYGNSEFMRLYDIARVAKRERLILDILKINK